MSSEDFFIKKIVNILPDALNEYGQSEDYYIDIAKSWCDYGIKDSCEVWDWIMIGYEEPAEVFRLKLLGYNSIQMAEICSIILNKGFKEDVNFRVIDKYREVELAFIEVHSKNCGIGTQFLNKLCEIADFFNKDIKLFPTNQFGSEYDRLVNFYRRFDFDYIKEPNIRDSNKIMIRKNKGVCSF